MKKRIKKCLRSLTVMKDLGCADTRNAGTPCRMGNLPRADLKVDRRAAEAAMLFHMIWYVSVSGYGVCEE